jgi:hypothetical protein
MFTTEHLSRLRETAAPHRRFVAFLAAIFGAILFASATFLEGWTANTNHRVQAVAALSPNTRVLFTGSSHVFATVNPARLRWPSMNLAAPVCSYVCIESIVRGNLPKVTGLAALVIEYDVVPAFYDTLRAYHGDYRQLLELSPDISSMQVSRWQKYELWRDRTLDESFVGPLLRFGKLTPEVALQHLRGDRPVEDTVLGPGYANGPEIMPADDDGPARVARHVREAPGPGELPRNEAALRRLITLALSKDLKVALVRFPHHPGYWAALPPSWQESMDQLLERLGRDFPGAFVYWDLGNLAELREADYRNGDHINDGAAARVTGLIEQRLASLLGERLDVEPPSTQKTAHETEP